MPRHLLSCVVHVAIVLLVTGSCGGGGGGGSGGTSALSVPVAPAAPAASVPIDSRTPSDHFVLSPANGSVIVAPTITVRVRGANWDEVWVESRSLSPSVAGLPSLRVDARAFQGDSFAIGVPLFEGRTQLVVTGHRAGAPPLTHTLQIERPLQSVEGLRISVSPSTVSNPATPVQITATFGALGTLTDAWLDADGDGRIDAAVSPTGSVSWTYATQGYFAPRLVVRAANGIYYDSASQPVPVTVTSPPSLVDTPGAFELPVPARDVCIDRLNGRVLVLMQDSRLRVFDEAGAFVSSHTLASVQNVAGIDVDEDGNVYAVDRGLHQLRKFTRVSGYLPDATFGTNGVVGGLGGGEAQFNEPMDVQCLTAVGGVEVWVADAGNQRLQRFDGAGGLQLQLPTGADIVRPASCVADYAGHVTVVDGADGDVAVFELSGTRIAYRPAAAGVDPVIPPRAHPDVDLGVMIADPAFRNLLRLDRDGAVLATVRLIPAVPVAAASSSNGRVLVAVSGAMRLRTLQVSEPSGESPVEVVTRFFTAVNQGTDATAHSLVAPEIDPLLTTVLADPIKGPQYRGLAGRVGAATELSRSGRLASVHAMVDPGTPGEQPIVVDLRRDGVTNRWLLLGL